LLSKTLEAIIVFSLVLPGLNTISPFDTSEKKICALNASTEGLSS